MRAKFIKNGGKAFFKIGLLSILVTLFLTSSVSAAYGDMAYDGYFKGNEETSGKFVLSGGIPTSVNTASEFINKIDAYYNNGTTWGRVGASYIIETMFYGDDPADNPHLNTGAPTNASASYSVIDDNGNSTTLLNAWKLRVNNYANGTYGSISWNTTYTAPDCKNTFYQDANTDVADYKSCTRTKAVNSIVFKDTNGKVVYAIKYTCGNPIGALTGLHKVNKMNIVVKCGLSSNVSFYAYAGAGTGLTNLDVYKGTTKIWGPGSTSGKTTKTISYDNTNDHVAYTYYLKQGGVVLDTYRLSACDLAPRGHVDAITCSGVSGWAFDPDDSDFSIKVRITVDGTTTYTYTTNVLRNDVNNAYDISGNHGFSLGLPTPSAAGHTYTVTALGIDDTDSYTGYNTLIGNGSPLVTSWTVKCAAPVVTMACSASFDLSGNAKDPDDAIALSISFTKDGAAYATGIVTTDGAGNFTVPVASAMNDGLPHTFVVTAKGVNSAGAQDGINGTATATCTPPASNCAGQNTKPVVTLPNAPQPVHSGATVSSSAPSGTQGNTAAVWYQETPQNSYQINDAYDQWGTGAAPVTTAPSAAYPAGTASPTGATHLTGYPSAFQASNQFTLDYAPYVTQYPYDLHQTTVLYTEKYSEQKYVPDTSKPSYGCPNGGTYVAAVGKCQYAATVKYTCPVGQYVSGTSCYDNSTNAYKGAAKANYSCPKGGTLDASHNCNYAPTVTYPWKVSGSAASINAQGAYGGTQQLEQCYLRQVSLVPASTSAGVAQVTPDQEDPNFVQFVGQVTDIFSRVSGETTSNSTPRQPNSSYVTVSVNAYYSSNPSATSGTSIPGCSPSQANIPLNSPNFDQAVTGATTTGTNNCSTSPSYSPPMQIGDYFCVSYTFTLGGSQTDRNGSMSGSSSPLTVSKCDLPLVNEPYAHFFDGDVSAGGGFAVGLGSCGAPSPGGITGFVKNAGSPETRGMSTQFAAISVGDVTNFGSASLRPSSPLPTGGAGLTFANTGSPLGNLGTTPCIGDYFYKHTLVTTTDPGAAASSGSIDTAVKAKHSYYHNGNMTLSALNLQDGASIAIYVDGDLSITGPMTFSSASSGWSNINDVPSLFIIVKGNMYIDSSVTNLDGVYIAQSRGAGPTTGIIDTCASGGASISPDSLLSACQSTLTVNGAFISQNVKFHRAYASVRNSQSGEMPINPPSGSDCQLNGTAGGSRSTAAISYDCSAEIFHLSPDIYLGTPQVPQQSGPTAGKYDYITSLSPVL